MIEPLPSEPCIFRSRYVKYHTTLNIFGSPVLNLDEHAPHADQIWIFVVSELHPDRIVFGCRAIAHGEQNQWTQPLRVHSF